MTFKSPIDRPKKDFKSKTMGRIQNYAIKQNDARDKKKKIWSDARSDRAKSYVAEHHTALGIYWYTVSDS